MPHADASSAPPHRSLDTRSRSGARSYFGARSFWPAPLILAALVAALIRPFPLPSPPRPAQSFHAIPAAIASLLWIQVAGRIPFLDRVTPAEAAMRSRQLAVITRLDAQNPEPWRYGTLGLSLWGRPDLAIRLGRAGLEHHPDDNDLRLMFHASIALASPASADTAARLALLLSAGADRRLPVGVRLVVLKQAAFTAIDDGRETEALTASRVHDELVQALADAEGSGPPHPADLISIEVTAHDRHAALPPRTPPIARTRKRVPYDRPE